MAIRSKDDAEQLRERARSMYFSNETVDWFLGSASAAQLRAVMDLLEYELDVRKRNKRARLYRRAKFPQVKSFEGYDFSEVGMPDGYTEDDLKSLSFVDAAQDFVFYGQTGRGKTRQRMRQGRQDGSLLHDRRARDGAGPGQPRACAGGMHAGYLEKRPHHPG